MPKKTAIGIETSVWRNIILTLYGEDWRVIEKYQNYDAGVDFDFMILGNQGEEILFGWDYIDEGEIKAKEKTFNYLEEKFGLNFEYGKPKCLTVRITAITRFSTFPKRFSASTITFFKDQFNIK